MRNRLNICECALNSFTILRRGFQRDSVGEEGIGWEVGLNLNKLNFMSNVV